jgi:beta-lactamase regulating signal transducer with metallopeptidase domain
MSIVEFLSQPLWQRLGLTLVHFLWQGMAVAVLVGAFVRVFRLKHGNARYGAYLLAFIAMIACPVVTFTAIDIPISPNTELVTGAESAEVVETFSYTALPAGDILPEAETPRPAMPTVANPIPLGQRISDWLNVSMPWILVIWMVGVVVLSVRLLMGFVGVYRWRHHLEPLPERLVQRIVSLSEGLRMRGFSRVFISPTVLQAMAVGYLRPMVLLPAAMVTQMQPEMLEAVIAHELAHIRRYDLWVNLIQRVTETLLFYHPAVWWLSNCIRRERELCCDELAVKATGRRLTYATTLESVGRAKVMAKQPILAAGLGQDKKPTLSRVRHILGLKPTKRNCPFWLAGVITVLFLAALVIPTTLALTNQSDEKLNDLERVVVEGIRANRDKFECGYLAWSSKQITTRFADSNRPPTELAGEYELWWDGNKKIATKYVRDEVHRDPEGNFRVEKGQGGTSYDGGVLSWKPDFHSDNWLGPEFTRWRGRASRDWMIRQESNMENIRKDWSVIDVNGAKLVRCKSKNINETARDYGGYSITDYDPSKGYGLVSEGWYNPDGSQRLKHTVKMLEVIPGGWFPVEVDFKSFAITDGKVYSHNHYALDIERCSFNDKSAFPARVFKGAIDKQLKYQEKLQKYLAMELEGISDVKEAAKADKVKLGAREAIEKFVAAAMAGDFETARQFVDPDKAMADIEDIPELLQGQNLWIMAVVADDFDAIAVSSVILGDHERIGPLVFFLDRKPQDGRDNWWVDDIDLETPDSAEVELKKFLEKHPKAQKVPYENKPDVQGKSQHIDVETLLNKVRQAQRPTENMIVEWQSEKPQPVFLVARRSRKPDFSPPSRMLMNYKAIVAGDKSRIEERELTFQSQKDTEPSRIREITYVFDGTMQKQLDHFVKGFENEYRGYRHTYDKNTQLLLKLLLAYPPYLDSPELQEKYNLKVIENKEKGLIILETSKENSGIHRYTIDPDKDYNIVKQEVILPRGTDYEINCIVKKQANGLWYQVAREKIRYSAKTGKPSLENKVKITKLDFNPEIPTGAFELQFPEGIKIWDGPLKDWIIVGDEEETSREPAVQVEGEKDSLIPKQDESSKEVFGITDALAVSDISGHLTIKSIHVAGLDGKKLFANKTSIFVDVVNSSDREVNLGLAYYTDSGTIAWFFSPGASGRAKALKVRPNWQGQLEFPMNYSRFANGGYVKITLARCSSDHIEGALLPHGAEVIHKKKYGVISVGQQKQVVRLLDTLRTAKGSQRLHAAEKLAKYGRSVVPAITEMLQDDNLWAAHALGLIGPEAEDAVPALIKSLTQGSVGSVRGFSASALRKIGPAAVPAIPALIGALKDKHGNTRMHAAEALGYLSTGEKDVIEALTAALQDVDETVRKAAGRSLKRIEDTISISTAKETDQVVAVPDDYITTLPNGVTVELMGVCDHTSEGKQWWRPDGTMLSKTPPDFSARQIGVVEGKSTYKLPVRLGNLHTINQNHGEGFRWTYKWMSEGAYRKSGYGAIDFPTKRSTILTQAEIYVLPEENSTTFSVGIAAGKWAAVASIPAGVDDNVSPRTQGQIVMNRPYEKDDYTYISIDVPRLKEAFRVIAVDTNGQTRTVRQMGGGGATDDSAVPHVFRIKMPLKQIDNLVFQTRPYEWVEFKNVSLRPGVKTDVQVEGEGIKTKIQKLVNGFWTAVIAKDWQAVNDNSQIQS